MGAVAGGILSFPTPFIWLFRVGVRAHDQTLSRSRGLWDSPLNGLHCCVVVPSCCSTVFHQRSLSLGSPVRAYRSSPRNCLWLGWDIFRCSLDHLPHAYIFSLGFVPFSAQVQPDKWSCPPHVCGRFHYASSVLKMAGLRWTPLSLEEGYVTRNQASLLEPTHVILRSFSVVFLLFLVTCLALLRWLARPYPGVSA